MSTKSARTPHIETRLADITTLDVDAIVNAANSRLMGGGGVDGAIHEAAGEAELAAACTQLGGCDPGDAKATPGFALPAQWIIHTVGPIWKGGTQREVEILSSCYWRSLEVADELGAKTIAFPSISTGAYGFPADLAARTAVTALRETYTAVRLVVLVDVYPKTLGRYEAALRSYTSSAEDPNPKLLPECDMPVTEVVGDLFDIDLPAIGHGCNSRGSMGAGIAVQFRRRYPDMYREYKRRCWPDSSNWETCLSGRRPIVSSTTLPPSRDRGPLRRWRPFTEAFAVPWPTLGAEISPRWVCRAWGPVWAVSIGTECGRHSTTP